MRISIVIPNWRGRRLLEKNLPSVLATEPVEIIVVDDASPDNSIAFLEKSYPEVRIIKHLKNLGFAAACNSGVREVLGEIVVLFNLDVVPEKEALKNILPVFEDERVFACSFNEPGWSWSRIFWKNGFIEHKPGPKTTQSHISAWASGGSAAFRKSMWEALEGFDEIYHPFYWEDIDLGYRAWKKGWKILWEPKAIVHHEHEAIIGKYYPKNYIEFISERNRIIFIQKNITDLRMILEHKLFSFLRLKNPGFLKPLLAARFRLPWILPKKIKDWKEAKISDREIFEKFA